VVSSDLHPCGIMERMGRPRTLTHIVLRVTQGEAKRPDLNILEVPYGSAKSWCSAYSHIHGQRVHPSCHQTRPGKYQCPFLFIFNWIILLSFQRLITDP